MLCIAFMPLFYVPSISSTLICHLPLHIQNGWNVLHHICTSDQNGYDILHWLFEEFTHCDLLKTRDFLNHVEQVCLSPLPFYLTFNSPSKSQQHPKMPKP